MADEAIIREDAAQIGMTGENDAHHVKRLALVPVCGGPNVDHRGRNGHIVVTGKDFYSHAIVVRER